MFVGYKMARKRGLSRKIFRYFDSSLSVLRILSLQVRGAARWLAAERFGNSGDIMLVKRAGIFPSGDLAANWPGVAILELCGGSKRNFYSKSRSVACAALWLPWAANHQNCKMNEMNTF
jgi:hypothetical protein